MPRDKKASETNRQKKLLPKRQSLFPGTVKYPSDPEQAQKWLLRIADHLDDYFEHYNGGPPFRFVADAIRKYLENPKTTSLQHELGLVYPVGNPGNFQSRMAEAKRGWRVVRLKNAGKSLGDICNEVCLHDKRSVKNLYKKYSPRLPKQLQRERMGRTMKQILLELEDEQH
ncbi:MAG: hypothetical protein QM706_06965 [Nitrospira sp.]